MSGNVILETERLRLVLWKPSDALLIQQLHSTIETTRYLSGASPWSLEKAQERLCKWGQEHALHGTTKYKVLSRDDDRFIGRAGFSLHGGEREGFELGYSLCLPEWGKGYATEIATALRDWFFAKQIAPQFIAYTHPDNSASQSVLTKIGMRSRMPMIVDGLQCPTFEYTAEMRG